MENSSWNLFAGSSNEGLAQELAKALKIKLGKVALESFPDGEIGVQILENVRGKDIFLLQSIALRPNHYLMELLIMVDALKRASAQSITAVIPYYGYARQDRKEKGRVPITAKLVANLLEKAGVTRLLTMDLHTEQIQGFFDIPVDHLYARPLLVKAIQGMGLSDPIVVSPDVGSNKMARKFAEELKTDLAIVDKRRVNAQKVEVNALIGEVKGKSVVLVDDICSTGTTLRTAAKVCKQEGAKQVVACFSHGLLVGSSLCGGEIDAVVTTDSVPAMKAGPQTKIVSIASLLGQAIDRIRHAESVSSLFRS